MSAALELACAADAAYVPHCAVMLRSVMEQHAGEPVRLHFLHAPDLAQDSLHALAAEVQAAGARFEAHVVAPERIAGLGVLPRIPAVMWYRVLTPELLPEVDRLLYLDCDTLVCERLDELWQRELGGDLAAACENAFDQGRPAHLSRLGLADTQPYFNSGVLLLNLDQWRAEGTSARIVELARARAAQLCWPDQDALNLALVGRWQALHPRWNTQNALYVSRAARRQIGAARVREATRRPGIVHFEGPGFCKPWHPLCKHPRRAHYLRLRAQTRWGPFDPLAGAGPGVRLLRLLSMGGITRVLLWQAWLRDPRWRRRLRRVLAGLWRRRPLRNRGRSA